MSARQAVRDNPLVETYVLFLVVFALQLVTELVGSTLYASMFVLARPLEVDPWTIVTSVYAHANLSHLLSNSVALLVFGLPIALSTSRLRFHVFFVTTGAIAGIAQVQAAGALGAEAGGVLGASGAVFALMGYLLTANRLAEGIAGWLDVPRWATAATFLGLAVVVTLATASPQAALIAHFTGFLLGLLAGRARLLRVERQSHQPRPAP